ncbi:MAG: 50S ribosomal protein L25 [Syntrophales bacterium]|jgi:large subunit ribosomal protein L25|nr:50S ribosomal protein L25 [Syntrophales bacterium]MCK9390330.1 50S ribosomal protein L25 [Syntrophales bacterium]
METIALRASARKTSGKGPARRARTSGLIPAVFYNPQAESFMLTVSATDMKNILKKKDENIFINLQIEEEGKSIDRMSIIKDIQIDCLTGQIIHIDFYEINMDHKLTVDVPVHFEGGQEAVKQDGGLLIMKREVSISCLPSILPDHFAVDISGLKIGEAFRVRDLPITEGMTILESEDTILAMISITREETKPEAEEEIAKEGPEAVKPKAKAKEKE